MTGSAVPAGAGLGAPGLTARGAAEQVEAVAAAFRAGDVAAALGRFCADADVVYCGSEAGEAARGPAEIGRLLHGLFSRPERYSWRCREVTVLPSPASAEVVAVLAETVLDVHPVAADGTVGPAAESVPYRVSGMLEATPAGWRWRLFQGAEPATG